jgi:hypothetical protein
MKNLEDAFLPVKEACLATKISTFHYFKSSKSLDHYFVWSESLEDSSAHSDNEKTDCILEGTVDFFHKLENDPAFDLIQMEFNKRNIDFYLNSTQYENETGFIHHEWVVKVRG